MGAVVLWACLAAGWIAAQTPDGVPPRPAEDTTPPPPSSAEEEPVPDRRFDTELPGTIGRGRVQFEVRPRWGDLVDEDVVRLPLEVSWGFRQHAEATFGLVPYVDNPFGEGSDHGPGGLNVGVEFGLGGALGSRTESSLGLRVFEPLGSPPPEIFDGWARITPVLAVSRRHRRLERLRVFVAARYQFVEDPTLIDTPQTPRPRSTLSIRPGMLWQEPHWGWSVEVPTRTDLVDGGSRVEVYLEPGVSYRTARGFGKRAMLRDRLEVGGFLRIGLNDTDTDLSAGGRLRVRFDAKRMWARPAR